jgi:hypothetical protein
MKKIFCKFFGHWMFFDTCDVTGTSTCKICGHKQSNEVIWPHEPPPPPPPPPMRVIKEGYPLFGKFKYYNQKEIDDYERRK